MKFSLFSKKKKQVMIDTVTPTDDKPIVHPFIANKLSVEVDATLDVPLLEWLVKEKNPCNRPLMKARVKQYQKAILNGTWDYDAGNSIRFDTDGNLLDGQHRIAAHINTATPMKTIVIYGIPAKSMKHIDENVPRNMAVRSLLSKGKIPDIGSVKFLNNKIAIVRCWNGSLSKFKKAPFLTMEELETFINDKDTFITAALSAGSNADTRRVGYRTAIAQYFEKDAAKAEEFHKGVSGDGANLSVGSPILCLRNYLRKAKGGGTELIKENYWVTLYMIHRFHAGQTAVHVKQKEEWDF